ncbi:enoyl-CoA hydratase-related protein [Nocardioides sp.]|uniref:enoyl-CoA hydratase-related protein n=1 Tax=Nocardioides sp. TaxID=35761 RepID=UPI003D0CC711
MSGGVGSLEQSVEGSVLVLTIRRGAKRNAIDQDLADQLCLALARLDQDPALRVGVVTGEPPGFCAGTDLSLEASPRSADGSEYGVIRRARRKPLIAAVEGFALGGGFEIVLACDLVVAASDARFGLPEVKRGLVANCGALFRAPDRLPPTIAMELLLTGEPIGAERAHSVGLVNRLAAPGQALGTALQLARSVAANSPVAVRETITAVLRAREQQEAALWPLTEAASEAASTSPDRQEGITAFFERREPTWGGTKP